MKIAQIAPLAESVPPQRYGGTERIVSYLTEELVDLGHVVTLFASGNSITDGVLEAVVPEALRLASSAGDPMLAYAALLERVAACAGDFDVVHAHVDWVHVPLLRRLGVPFLTTLHGRLDMPLLAACFDATFGGAPFVSISDSQRRPLSGTQARWLGTVYHGLPRNLLRPAAGNGGYLAFLGRIAPEKGPEAAIRIARAAGLPLRIAAKVDKAERRYYMRSVAPLIDGDGVQFVGEVDERGKAAFLGGAAALLFPIDWPEPFGLVMIEAMACGTPVIAFPRGSVPEIVEHGVTGFVVENERDAVGAVARLPQLDRARIRQAFERQFTARRMAEDYLHLYRQMTPAAMLETA
jgi:glycosyltransferase involved in cell wall biosynthesis